MEGTNIIPINIEDEMRGSYLDYAMSVIIGRALPDIRDGLKPVHRRILFAMLNEGLVSNKKHSKCAGVVGEVLKHLHPHGDSAVYDALVRMAQDWSMRYKLIDGQGNFGSIDGDSAAAYRYTECRMRAIAEAMLADIDKDTVDHIPNFDESMMEPVVLPARIPNLLINGAEGIAVGMASRIPPHNLREVVKACIAVINNPDVTLEELMEFVPGPDFPTGGIIYGAAPLKQIYLTGRGTFKIRAKIHVETLTGSKRETEAIIVDEVPYQTNKARLVEKIAELVNERRIDGIVRLRDESDRNGMRIVMELRRDAVTDVVINQLYKLTPLERTFGVIMLSIVDGRPRVFGLREVLNHFINHRRQVVTRRCEFELNKAQARQHIVEGLRRALDHIDEVVKTIRESQSTAIAREALQVKFSFSQIQAQHILDMPLKRLTGMERQALDEEYNELCAIIARLIKILSDAAEVDAIIIEELNGVVDSFGDDRKTVIEQDGEDIDFEDLIADEQMVVTVSHKGYVKRCSPSLYKAQKRGGKGVQGNKKLSEEDEDFIEELFVASTHSFLLVFTSQGKLHWLKVHKLPETNRTARGRAIVNMLKLEEDETVSALLPIRNFAEGWYVVLVTRKGCVKRVDLMAFSNIRTGGIRATSIDPDDGLVGVALTNGEHDCVVSTRQGMAIRFDEQDVRVMGRTARGVRAITLNEGDEVVSFTTVPHEGKEEDNISLFTVCERGYGKRTLISEYRTQGRGGKGLIDIKTDGRNGVVVSSCRVSAGDGLMLITNGGKVIRISVDTVSLIGRNTMGVRLINLDENEVVAAVARIADSKEDDSKDDESSAGDIIDAEATLLDE